MVKRYDMRDFDHSIERYEDGGLVSYEDYVALAERCERLEASLRKSLEWVPEVASASARRLLSEKKEPNK